MFTTTSISTKDGTLSTITSKSLVNVCKKTVFQYPISNMQQMVDRKNFDVLLDIAFRLSQTDKQQKPVVVCGTCVNIAMGMCIALWFLCLFLLLILIYELFCTCSIVCYVSCPYSFQCLSDRPNRPTNQLIRSANLQYAKNTVDNTNRMQSLVLQKKEYRGVWDRG